MIDLTADLPLKRAWQYSQPEQGVQALPLVYGDMSQGGQGGLWQAVCLNQGDGAYALAGHPLLEQGNQVTLYDSNGAVIDPGDYSLNLSHDFEGQGLIATATLGPAGQDLAPISLRAQGKPDQAGGLLSNPVSIVSDLLLSVCGAGQEDLETSSLSRAWALAENLGFQAAGVVSEPRPLAEVLTELLSTFLGSWWLGPDGRLKASLGLGPGAFSEGELTTSLEEANLKQVEVSARLDSLVNQVETLYCLNPLTGQFQAGDSGQQCQDLASQGLYGLRRRQVELKWVRSAQTAATIASRLVGLLASPRRLISCQETSLRNIHLERGDTALLSLSWLCDQQGHPLENHIVQVLSLEPQLDQGITRFQVLATGYWLTTAFLADGSLLADGRVRAGGDRYGYEPQATAYSLLAYWPLSDDLASGALQGSCDRAGDTASQISAASGLVEPVAADTARFEAQGLLIEQASANLLALAGFDADTILVGYANSAPIYQSVGGSYEYCWNLTVQTGSGAATLNSLSSQSLRGPASARSLQVQITNGGWQTYHIALYSIPVFSLTVGHTYTLKLGIWSSAAKTAQLVVQQQGAPWNNLGLDESPDLAANDWTMLKYTFTATASDAGAAVFLNLGGVGAFTVRVDHLQLEEQAAATSLIRSLGAPASRPADVVSLPVPPGLAQAQGCVRFFWRPGFAYGDAPAGAQPILSLHPSEQFIYSDGGDLKLTDGVNTALASGVNWDAGQAVEIEAGWSGDGLYLKIDGGAKHTAGYSNSLPMSGGNILLARQADRPQHFKDLRVWSEVQS